MIFVSWPKTAAARKITRWAALAVAIVVVAVGFALYGCRASTPPEDLACCPDSSNVSDAEAYAYKCYELQKASPCARLVFLGAPSCAVSEDHVSPVNWNTEEYRAVGEQSFVAVATNPLSTFGADVDTAGYANMRRMIMSERRLPPPESVRL